MTRAAWLAWGRTIGAFPLSNGRFIEATEEAKDTSETATDSQAAIAEGPAVTMPTACSEPPGKKLERLLSEGYEVVPSIRAAERMTEVPRGKTAEMTGRNLRDFNFISTFDIVKLESGRDKLLVKWLRKPEGIRRPTRRKRPES